MSFDCLGRWFCSTYPWQREILQDFCLLWSRWVAFWDYSASPKISGEEWENKLISNGLSWFFCSLHPVSHLLFNAPSKHPCPLAAQLPQCPSSARWHWTWMWTTARTGWSGAVVITMAISPSMLPLKSSYTGWQWLQLFFLRWWDPGVLDSHRNACLASVSLGQLGTLY